MKILGLILFAIAIWFAEYSYAHDIEPIRVEIHKELPNGEVKVVTKYFDTQEQVAAWHAGKVAEGCDVNVERIIMYPYGKLND